MIGQWLGQCDKQTRAAMHIATKVAPPEMDGIQGRAFDQSYIEEKLGISLERLGVERVTFYLSHAPDPNTPIETTLEGFAAVIESGRVEHWDTDGNFVGVLVRDLRMPACVQIRGDFAVIAELQGRVTVLGKNNEIVAQLGDNPDPKQRANYGLEPTAWTEGVFNSPHGISFDRAGNIVISEWSQFGRISKFALKR